MKAFIKCKKTNCFANRSEKGSPSGSCGCLRDPAIRDDGSCAFYKEKTRAFNQKTIENDIAFYAEKQKGGA